MSTPAIDAMARLISRRVEGRSGDGVARAGSGSRQVPVGQPRERVSASFGAPQVARPTTHPNRVLHTDKLFNSSDQYGACRRG